jgi:hypothetical protein
MTIREFNEETFIGYNPDTDSNGDQTITYYKILFEYS